MSKNTRRFMVQAEFEYEAEILDDDPQEPWAFADLQQSEIQLELLNLPGIRSDYPIKVVATPDRDD